MADQKSKPKFDYLLEDPDDIDEVEAGEYVVEGYIPQSEVTFVCGPAKHLKTFLVPSWVLCAATGRPWFGHKVKRCRVVYNIGEGSDAFMGRVKAWQIHNKVPKLDGYFKVLRRMINLFDPVKFVAAVNKIKAQYEPEILVIDTFGRAMGGADEKTKDFNKLFEQVDALQQEHWPGLTLIIVHHTRKGDLIYRGPGVLAGDCDNIIYVERVRKELRANVICEFFRNAAEFEDFSFTLVPEQVRTKKGLKPFLVVDDLAEAVGTVGDNTTEKAKRQRELDELAHRVLVGEYEGADSWTESVAWFELVKAKRGDLGLGTTTFSNCRKRLLAKQMIRMWETAKNKFYQAVFDGREAAAERSSRDERSEAAPEGPSTPTPTPTPSTLTPRLYRRGVQELRSDPGSAPRSSGVVSSQSGNGHSQESSVAASGDKAQQALELLLNKKSRA